MTPAAVAAGAYLHHIQLRSGDPGTLAAFYADAMDMQARPLGGGEWICEGPHRRLLLAPGDDRTLGYGAFAVRDGEALAMMRDAAERAGVPILRVIVGRYDAGELRARIAAASG